jgi:HPt (histidine-containing phosphotransfer) domain-containing protein
MAAQSDATASKEPVDLGVLRAQSGGDVSLEREVLALYLRHAPEDMAALKAAGDRDSRRRIAHRMVGSARSIGAAAVARQAAGIERGNVSTLAALETAVAEACAWIAGHLAE